MRYAVLFLIATGLLFGCHKQAKTSAFPNSFLNVKITRQRFLDKSIVDSMKIYIPGAVQTDSSGNVYIFDNAQMNIKVFSKDGRPLQIIGGRGRGPGEFISNSGFFVYRNSLHVFDQELKRLNIFSTNGILDTTFSFNATEPVILKPLGKNFHLAIYSERTRPNSTNINYARVLNNEFYKIRDSFLNITSLIPALEGVESILKFFPGNFLTRGNDTFIYTPFFTTESCINLKEQNSIGSIPIPIRDTPRIFPLRK